MRFCNTVKAMFHPTVVRSGRRHIGYFIIGSGLYEVNLNNHQVSDDAAHDMFNKLLVKNFGKSFRAYLVSHCRHCDGYLCYTFRDGRITCKECGITKG